MAGGHRGRRLPISRRVITSLLILMLLAAAAPAIARPPDGRFIVVFKGGVTQPGEVAREHARTHGARLSHVYAHALKGYAAEMPEQAAARIASDARVAYVERDQQVHAFGEVPTGVGRIEADKKLSIDDASTRSVNVDIAILDTGIDGSHADLNVVGGWNCAKGGPNNTKCDTGGFDDGNGHGTHVAGTAAAIDDAGGLGVVGVAPGARLWAVKVLDSNGSGWISWIVAGINRVSANASTIEIANMSLGCECDSQSLDDAVTNSTNAGVVYVVAAGNSGANAATHSPANHPQVIATSAVADYDGSAGGTAAPTCRDDSGSDDSLATWSNYGTVVDIAAPGVCILSTVPGGGYASYSGTSMASPHAAGAAALYVVENGVAKSSARWSIVRDGLRGGGWSVPQSDACGFTGGKSAEPFMLLATCDSSTPPDGEAPGAPTGLLASDPATGGTLNLDWADNSEADLAGYNVYRSDDGVSFERANLSLVSSSAYTDSGLVNGSIYYYRVTAVDSSANESLPSATASGTPTGTAAPPAASTVHVHDLDGAGTSQRGGAWFATVTIFVFDGNENPVSGAEVSGSWSAGAASGTCTTNSSGWCQVTSDSVHKGDAKQLAYSVANVSSSLAYDAQSNHDDDGDSTGTSITVTKPN